MQKKIILVSKEELLLCLSKVRKDLRTKIKFEISIVFSLKHYIFTVKLYLYIYGT